MQRFTHFIPWSLVAVGCLQVAFCLSQDLEPRLESTLFDEISLEDITPTDQTSTSDSNGFPAVDFLNTAMQSDLDWLSANVDLNSPDSINLFSDIPYSDEPDSISLFAKTDSFCDAVTTDDIQLFGKRRRETSKCKSPYTGEAASQNGPDHDDGPGQSEESNPENIPQVFAPLSIFPEDFDLCPPTVFKDSNIPVCRTFVPGTYVLIPGQQYVTLLDVAPRRCFCSLE